MQPTGCLLQQPSGVSAVSHLLPRQHTASLCPHRRSCGIPCAGISQRSSSSCNSNSSRQQVLRGSSCLPLPGSSRLIKQQQQRHHWLKPQQQQRQQHVTARAAVEVWPTLDKRSSSKYVNSLNEEHGVPGFFEFYQSVSGQPVLYIMHPRGHTLEVQLQGATVTRWLKPDGEDLLHVRSDAQQEPGQPINSGIPLAFPQWRDGQLPYNGFADKLEWTVVGTEFDGEFVNTDVSSEQWVSGEVRLAVDPATGQAQAPRPYGLLEESDVKGEYDPDSTAKNEKRIDNYFEAQPVAQATTQTTAKGTRGKQGKKAKEEAEAAAAAAAKEETRAAAAAAEADATAAAAREEEAAVAAAAAAEDAAAAAAAAAPPPEEQEGGDEGLEGLGYGIVEDLAPYVILQLTDTEETRAIWPHKFELYYKITLMESDEFPDPLDGLPRGVFEFGGSDAPVGPQIAALREMMNGDDPDLARAAAASLAERYRASNIRSGVGLDSPFSETEMETLHPLPGVRSSTGMRFFTDDDGQMNDEEALAAAEDAAKIAAVAGRPLRGAAAASKKRAAKAKAAEAEEEGAEATAVDPAVAAAAAAAAAVAATPAAAAAAAVPAAGTYAGELPTGYHTPVEDPMQIKLEWVLINNDPEDSPPMEFQLGALPHFQTEDQSKHGEFVRVLGLGGSTFYDWSADSRRPMLKGCQTDYVNFDGERHDAVYVGTDEADVMFCPGSRTHFELLAREGLPDTAVWHPGASGLPGLEVEPRFFAALGSGRLALPKTLAPGETWKGELVIRHHEKYWEPPVFDRDSAQPMPKLVTQKDDADDREDIDEGVMVEGVISSQLGGGSHVPFNDM